ncbi:tRNA(Met) cytidine acetyltransferase protein [Dioscorea alata]|uniref:tRNA(Met) cytidine acetyltransferase protein n=1 Tax=Dioscorea alata TaxID=55571 RepID=A0ACB7WFE4_DIOAL|nr:tRNA(Met) cytidine acetyltransferase protein [Dioscorea alata]
MMALYVASHYKNSPNDLQLMADAPSHHLFVLLGPVDESKNQLPDILCVIQVSLEGQISRKSAIKSLSEGHQPFGDQIPWKFCEQFQDNTFPSLSGARIVRIAVHPSALRLGYGSVAVELLARYYEGQLTHFTEAEFDENEEQNIRVTEAAEKVSLLEENITPRANLPPLLVHLRERRPEKLHYLGVSFGLTRDLFRFWRKHNFVPFYIGQIPSAVTGEHTCMVLKPLNNDEIEVSEPGQLGFLSPFYEDFKQRFSRLLGTTFRALDYKLAMSILASKISFAEHETLSDENSKPLQAVLSPYDMKRLEAYTNNHVDYHMILDLVPILAHQYFQEKIPMTLTPVQASVLFCIGMQNQDISYIKEEMKLEREQILSLFIKVMKKLYNYLYSIAAKDIDSTLPRLKDVSFAPHSKSVDEDLNEAAREVMEKMKAGNEVILDPELLQQYAIVDREGDFEKALQSGAGKVPASGLLSVKSNRPKKEKPETNEESSRKNKRKGDGHKDRSKFSKKNKS